MTALVMGWGYGIKEGDYLLLPALSNSLDGRSRYRIETIKYLSDPPDMWTADVTFAPRTRWDEYIGITEAEFNAWMIERTRQYQNTSSP